MNTGIASRKVVKDFDLCLTISGHKGGEFVIDVPMIVTDTKEYPLLHLHG